MDYIILRKFLDNRTCQELISFSNLPTKESPLGLLDGDDVTNHWYESKRSPGLSYRYSDNEAVMSISKGITGALLDATGIDFSKGINSKCLPFCKYANGGIIKPHRDIDKVRGLDKSVKYVVICMLTQVGNDFTPDLYANPNNHLEDSLFINNSFDINVSKDGKIVSEYDVSDRFYPNLNKGDVLIFRNSNSIHGVDPIRVFHGQIGRITCGFRSE